MALPNTPPAEYDMYDEEAFAFDEDPHLFVRLDTDPIVFTARGIRYFAPRFRDLGLDIARITMEPAFRTAEGLWARHERACLLTKIAAKAASTNVVNEHQVLQAILDGDTDAQRRAVHRLDHQRRAGLKMVGQASDPAPG